MAGGNFTFQQFTIHQERCAMKVGTDGVLLGAWAQGGRRILDIGTGTGLIALMMAQRYPEAQVTAIDIDGQACCQARDNVADSPFARRVQVVHSTLQQFASGEDACGAGAYDSIVSNPPYFVDSLKNPDSRRAMARHTDTLPVAQLMSGARTLLAPGGTFSIIVPTDGAGRFVAEASLNGLLLARRCDVCTTPRKAPRRTLLAFANGPHSALDTQRVVLQELDGTRSAWYAGLTEGFYL